MNLVFLKILLVVLFLEISECAKVYDADNQKDIDATDYCAATEDCPEGTHVMCMYYKPGSIAGPYCIDPKNVSITSELAARILDIVNAMRSKLAYGQEMGKGGKLLPRGYGINRLRWDSELATFAQVFANQCLLRHDMCRATKRFHDPSQTVGLVRFDRNTWMPVITSHRLEKPGFGMDKIKYAVERSLYSWYSHKNSVTAAMIDSYPDWTLTPANTKGWHYLKMAHGPVTHMGCGVSAHAEYHYATESNIYNGVQLVCNFSAQAKKGQPVYTKQPPTEVGYTMKCGCPEGFEEDIDCLCSEIPFTPPPRRTCDGINCEPAVVLLPIFTVEDAPAHKVAAKSRRAESDTDSDYLQLSELTGNTTSFFQDHNDIFKALEGKGTSPEPDTSICKDSTLPGALSLRKSAPLDYNKTKTRPLNNINQQSRRNYRIKQEAAAAAPKMKRRLLERKDRYPPLDVKNRYFGRSPRVQSHQRGYDHGQRKIKSRVKPSIFSRVHKFELPGTGRRNGTKLFTVRLTDFKRDVAPRKDFSYTRKLLNNYLDKKRHHEDYSLKTFRIINYYETSTLTAFVGTTRPTPRVRYNFSNPQVKINRYMVTKFHYPEFNTSNEPLRKRVDIKNSNEEADRKLMALLDNLEQEVNHIDLNMNEKEIFDAKIRKIYGSVVGRDNNLLPSKITNDHDNFKKDDSNSNAPINVLEDLNKKVYDDRIFETEDKIKELHLKLRPGLYSRPVVNNLNSLEYDEKNGEPKHCESDANSCALGLTDHEEINRPYFEEKRYKNRDKSNVELLRLKDDVTLDNLDTNDIRTRNIYKAELDNKKLKDIGNLGESRKKMRYKNRNVDNNGPRHSRYRNGYRRKNGYKDKEGPDPLGVNRRKMYQQKLDNLGRRMHDFRNYRRRNEHERERAMRLMRPSTRDEVPIRPSAMKSPVGPIYMPERARFLHGF